MDAWIGSASKDVAQDYLTRAIDHIEANLVSPLAGRPRDDLRQWIGTTTYKGRTLIAYEADESSGQTIVAILGVFHGGQKWEAELRQDLPRPSSTNADYHVSAGQRHIAVDDHQQPLSVPRFPWYY